MIVIDDIIELKTNRETERLSFATRYLVQINFTFDLTVVSNGFSGTSHFCVRRNQIEKMCSDLTTMKQAMSGNTTLDDNSIAYLPNNNQPSIILKKDIFKTTEKEIKEKNWHSALTMQAKWTSQILHPETSDKEWLSLVKYSFVSKVMTPVTSYLVVENEAQKDILKMKQEQVLSGNNALDLDEDTQRMCEPSFWVLTILFGLIMWYRQKRNRQLTE
jgi:hypothetical protein